jgi:2-alkyl-3-oxoalkanoate reductase
MKALVTGGSGFLGNALVRGLLARGAEVRSFCRNDHAELRQLGVRQLRGDLADAPAVAAAVAGCDIVFHVAAKAGVWGPYEEYHRANVIGTENVIAACRRHGVSRLVYTSSPSVVFDGKDMAGMDESAPYPARFVAHYSKSKALAEQKIKAACNGRLATVALRPHLIWGPGDNHLLPRLAARATAGQLCRIGTQEKLIDTIYIDNAVSAHLLAADRLEPGSPVAGKAYFISQGEPVEVWTMINRLLQAAGAPPVDRSLPASLAMVLAWGFEIIHRLRRAPGEPRLTRFAVRELSSSHWFNINAAKRDLGYAPVVPTEEGLRRLREHFESRGRALQATLP